MTAESRIKHPDRSLAIRDAALPGLPYLLDNQRLSELLGESVHITRVRYRPRTSLQVAYRRTRNGSFDYGWALTRAAKANGKLLRREEKSRARGGDIRILHPDLRLPDTLVAVGGVEDDWALRENLAWLREHGPERLGLRRAPGSSLLGGSTTTLRYKPGRCLVLLFQNAGAPLVVKAAAKPLDARHRQFHETLHLNGVPVLPQLGDAECAEHGISACAAWGGGDLAGLNESEGARRAGEALARVHGMPPVDSGAGRPFRPSRLADQLAETRSVVASLVPALEEPARRLEAALRTVPALPGSRERVLIHGDFSPEQVLVNGAEVRILDFGQAHAGAPEADLGSFAAAEEAGQPLAAVRSAGGPTTASLTEGYAQAGGRFSQGGVNAWAAFRLFTGCMEPFNDRAPDWAADMAWHLRRAQDLIVS